MLVRSPRLTSNKSRDLVSSGRLVCRCHVVVLWGYVCFVLFRFRLFAFTEAAALRSIVLRCARASIATRSYLTTVCILLCFRLFFYLVFLFFFGFVAFSEYFLYHQRFLFVWRVCRTFFFFRVVFFYLVTTGCGFLHHQHL